MFATLLDPPSFAATSDERIELLRTLGGPYLTDDESEARLARSAGLQIGFAIDAPDGNVAAHDAATVHALAPEIVAVRCAALCDAAIRDEAVDGVHRRRDLLERLAASLATLRAAGASTPHRMLIPLRSGSLAPFSAGEWGGIPAESLVIDPIADPDAWRAAATWPGSRGLVLALVPPPGGGEPEGAEILLWAVGYAASLGGRGGDRVGVAASLRAEGPVSPAPIDRGVAERRVALLAELVALTGADAATRRARLDPRATSPASAERREQRAGRHGG